MQIKPIAKLQTLNAAVWGIFTHAPRPILFFSLVLWFAATAISQCQEQPVIFVKPTATWSVTGQDDIQQLKRLAAGVGHDFQPNAQIMAELKRIGIKTIRCINVDPLPGQFDPKGRFIVGDPGYLLYHLKTCREVGANPHVIIAAGLHPDLQLKEEDLKESERGIMGNQLKKAKFGPTDWTKYREYCRAYFEYVLVTQNFPNAEFEVANEPDIGGVICPKPPKPANGSAALYEAYYNLYRNVAQAAEEFEKAHPGVRVKLGGPALAWAFTFKFGDFNWADRFLRDCGRDHTRLDFLGIHYYGNLSSLDGEYSSLYPSFTDMLKSTVAARDRHCPGVPVWITEYGSSYVTSNEPHSVLNGNHIGAAWTAAFLNAMLQHRVEKALHLATTDLQQPVKEGSREMENIWGWPSFFVNPQIFGKVIPKATFHVFDMISRLEGGRVEATRGGATVNTIVSADPKARRVTALIWNYGCQIPETGMPIERAVRENVTLRIREAGGFFGSSRVKIRRWLVSETMSNAHYLFQQKQPLDERALLQEVDGGTFRIVDDTLDIGVTMPPSSVSLVVLDAG